MRDNAKIEVTFRTKDNKPKKVIIEPGSPVTAIILNGPVVPGAPVPPGLTGEGLSQVEGGDGPLVCYLIGGELHCW